MKMDYAVTVLQDALADNLAQGDKYKMADELRAGIMVLNRQLFHQKIKGSDPNNEFYGS
jgi:hypothetical protein